MASKLVREINLGRKGRTGMLTSNRRKKRGMKCKLHGKHKPQGAIHGTPPQGVAPPNDPK
jgi:hypothetical protein